MTLDRCEAAIKCPSHIGSFFNGNSVKLILSEVQREQGLAALDEFIREMRLDEVFGFEPGTRFEGGLAMGKLD